MFYYLKKYFFIVALMSLALGIHGRSLEQKTDTQSWWSATGIGTFYNQNKPTAYKYWLEGIQRMGDDNTRSTQRMARIALGYDVSETTSLWFGMGWIYTGIPVSRVPYSERRLWQQWLWSKTYAESTLTHRVRLEERFVDYNPRTGWRIRDFIKMVSPFARYPRWSIVGSNEVFWNLNNLHRQRLKGFNQNRFFMGIGHQFNPHCTVEVGYLQQYIHRFDNGYFLSNNIATNASFSL